MIDLNAVPQSLDKKLVTISEDILGLAPKVSETIVMNQDQKDEALVTLEAIAKRLKFIETLKTEFITPFKKTVADQETKLRIPRQALEKMKVSVNNAIDDFDSVEFEKHRKENERIQREHDEKVAKEQKRIIEETKKNEPGVALTKEQAKEISDLSKDKPELKGPAKTDNLAGSRSSVHEVKKWKIGAWDKNSRLVASDVIKADKLTYNDLDFLMVNSKAVGDAVKAGKPVPAWVEVYMGTQRSVTV